MGGLNNWNYYLIVPEVRSLLGFVRALQKNALERAMWLCLVVEPNER